jgi:hypothetical protein
MLRFAQHDKLVDACAPFSMTAVWSFRTLFFVIPNACEESTYGCFASLSMTNWWMLHFVQHDSRVVIPNTLFCHSERSEESSVWMLRFAQHDKLVDASLRSA